MNSDPTDMVYDYQHRKVVEMTQTQKVQSLRALNIIAILQTFCN